MTAEAASSSSNVHTRKAEWPQLIRRPRVKEHIDFFFLPLYPVDGDRCINETRKAECSVSPPHRWLSPADAPGRLSGKHVVTSRFTFKNMEQRPSVSVKITGTATLVPLLIILLQDNKKLLICTKKNILFILPPNQLSPVCFVFNWEMLRNKITKLEFGSVSTLHVFYQARQESDAGEGFAWKVRILAYKSLPNASPRHSCCFGEPLGRTPPTATLNKGFRRKTF